MSIQIPGLPEGVEAVRFGIAGPEDFEVTMGESCGIQITKGVRQGTTTQVIVKPSPGYEFKYDIRSLTFRAVKKLDNPVEITRTVKFIVTNALDQGIVEDRLDALKDLPGYQDAQV